MTKPSILTPLFRYLLALALLALPLLQQQGQPATDTSGLGMGAGALVVMEAAGKRQGAPGPQPLLPEYKAVQLATVALIWVTLLPSLPLERLAQPSRLLLQQLGRWQLEGG